MPREETRAATVRPQLESSEGGLFFCTTEDYGRFAQMLLNGGTLDGERILGRKPIELMRTDHLGLELRKISQAIPTSGRKATVMGSGYGSGIALPTRA